LLLIDVGAGLVDVLNQLIGVVLEQAPVDGEHALGLLGGGEGVVELVLGHLGAPAAQQGQGLLAVAAGAGGAGRLGGLGAGVGPGDVGGDAVGVVLGEVQRRL